MRRLVETARESGDAEQRLAELIQGALPYRPNPFTKRMVLQRLTRATLQPAAFAAHSVLAPALALVGGTGVAVAAVGWFATRAPAEAAVPPPLTPVLAPAAPPPLPAAANPAAAPPRAEGAPRSSARPPREARARVTREGEDPSQVLEAIRALRKRGDAARAQVLLDHYLATHPGGVLTEDALALAIEAASARHDPRAADYARRYLARFPNGRFRAVALRAAGRD